MPSDFPVYDKSRPLPFRTLLYQYEPANAPGFTLLAFRVTLPPHGSFPPHRHGGASVIGHVLDGAVLNAMNEQPAAVLAAVLAAGESWYEAPGCHHRVFDNHLVAEQTTVLATYLVASEVVREGGLEALTVIDDGVELS